MSVNIISLNQIVDLFSGFADRHYFLNDFGFGPTSEIGTSRQMDFPYMWVTLNENSVINPQNRTAIPELAFSVLFMDKTNIQSNYLEINGDNSNNVQEILSDMLQVLQDFITEVQVDWGNYGIIFQDSITCFPATDETQDKVNGWVGQFSFKLKHSNCILPTGDIAQTNLSPINPMTRYLTCDTVTACTTLQQYITQQISNFTGGTGNYVPYTGATQNVELGTFSMIMNDGITDSEMSPSYFGVEINGGSEFSLLEYNQLSLVDNNNLISLFITPSGITFPNGSIQTTAFTGFTDTFVTGGTYSNGTATFTNNSGGTFNVSGFYTGSTDNNQFVTGYTYLDNTFTIADNSGNTFNATINTMTGLTINGNLDVTTIDEVDTIDFNLSPTGTNGIGRLRWNNTDGTLDLGLKGGNVTLQVGQETVVRVVNKTGTLIPNGSVVKVVQVTGGVTGIALSLGDNDLNSAGTIGITTEDIADNAQGFVTIQGLVHELNTNAFTEGDVLYLSPTIPGGITNVKPIAPQHMVIVGYCVKKNLTDGHILLHVQNGYELGELHNVQLTGTTKGGSTLTYNTSTSVWTDEPIVWTIELINALSVDVYAPYNLSIDVKTNILNSPTITIYDDNVLYTLGNTIAIGSKITIVATSIGVTNLTLSKI